MHVENIVRPWDIGPLHTIDVFCISQECVEGSLCVLCDVVSSKMLKSTAVLLEWRGTKCRVLQFFKNVTVPEKMSKDTNINFLDQYGVRKTDYFWWKIITKQTMQQKRIAVPLKLLSPLLCGTWYGGAILIGVILVSMFFCYQWCMKQKFAHFDNCSF